MPLRRRDALALLVVVAALVWLGRPRAPALRPPPLPPHGAERSLAPSFALPRAGGGAISSADGGDFSSVDDGRGRVLVVNFWATWCPPCREELPALARLQDGLAGQGLLVLAVSVDARPAAAARYAHQRGLALTVLGDPREEVARRFGVRAYPTTVVVDRAGRVAHRVVGGFAWDAPETVAWLRGLLSE